MLALVDAGIVGRVGHVDHDGHVGLEPAAEERAPPPVAAISSRVVATAVTAAPARRSSAASSRRASSTTKAPMRLSMHRLTSRPLGNSSTPAASTPGIADPELRLGLGPARGADVDPEVFDLGDLFPIVLVHEVDRLLADHAGDRALPAQQTHPLPHEDLVVPAADGVEAEKPSSSMWVTMTPISSMCPANITRGRPSAVERGERVARHVGLHRVGETSPPRRARPAPGRPRTRMGPGVSSRA